MTDHIRIDQVSRRFGQGDGAVDALDEVSLTIRRGEVVAMVGPSGSGKTTLLNCIAGLDRPDRGTIDVFGTPVHALAYEEAVSWRRNQVAIVFQSAGLLGHLSAAENVDMALRLRKVPRRERQGRVAGGLDALGIGELANHRPGELSGGQRQRVALARALALRPALLIADEPTGQLDVDTTEQVLHELWRPVADHGLTLLIATHDPDVEARADRSIRLVDGRIDRPQS